MERILKLPQSFYSKEQLPKALRINFSKMRIDFKIYFYIQSIFEMDFNLTMSIQEKDEFIDELWR